MRVVVDVKSQPHEFMIVRLPAGKTIQDVMAWVAHPVGLPPAETIEGIAPMQPGTVAYGAVDFKPGHYVLLCLVPDAKDGKAHALHGMVEEFITSSNLHVRPCELSVSSSWPGYSPTAERGWVGRSAVHSAGKPSFSVPSCWARWQSCWRFASSGFGLAEP